MPDLTRLRKWVAVSAAALLALSCGPSAPEGFVAPPKFVANDATFADFRTWERFPLEDPMLPVEALPGPAFVYANRRPEPGMRRWPLGTVLVKTVEPSADMRDWTVHAMVKRSERFNLEGSVGWEFFRLQLDREGAAIILWRNEGDTDGHAYGRSERPTDAELTCNDCHALHWQDDSVLTPALSLAP